MKGPLNTWNEILATWSETLNNPYVQSPMYNNFNI